MSWRRSGLFLAAILLIHFGKAEPVTNLSISLRNADRVEIKWPAQHSNSVYTVQWTQALPASRWLPARPWTNWPSAVLAYSEPLRLDGIGFFRVESVRRGRVLESAFQQQYSLFEIRLILAFSGLDIGATPEHAVDAYRIVYETLDPWLGGSRASGLLLVPRGLGEPAPLVSYQHGTMFERAEAPTSPESLERLVGVVAASTGYVVVMPDYWGLGLGSTGLHPYSQTRAGATAVVDLLRAARTVLSGLAGISLSGKLFLTGYSQGGQVTLAAQRELEERHEAEFTIAGSAAMEGPYDLSGTMFDLLLAEAPYTNPEYFPYVIFSFNQLYNFFQDPAEVFLNPYATNLPPLFDGEHSAEEVSAAMPPSGVPSQIMRPELVAALRTDPGHPWRAALREHDLLGWRPRSPTRLVHCGADPTVPAANALAAYASFVAGGASHVQLVDPDPDGDHASCLEPAARDVLAWFESLR